MREAKASASAMTVALVRAHLDWLGIVDDPHAISVLTRRHRATAMMFRRGPLADYGTSPTFGYVACRTCFFDDAVRGALDAGLTQVVILGAGYDSRPLRLARPGVRYFEVDHPATQAEKRRRLPSAETTYVGIDLSEPDALGALLPAGFEPGRPAVFLAEGLTMYLDRVSNEKLFGDIADVAASGSRLAVDFARGGGSVSLPSQIVASLIRVSWQLTGEKRYDWADRATAVDLLQAANWKVTEWADGPTLAEHHLSGTRLREDGISPAAFCVLATRT